MFSAPLITASRELIDRARELNVRLTTAESCTGGLLSALLTEVPGSSKVLERGFVVYSNRAKQEMIDVPGELIADHGAVSEAVSIAMAEGALEASRADFSIAITGLAGPSGGTALKPVGLVHFAVASKSGLMVADACRFGEVGRSEVRRRSLLKSIDMLQSALDQSSNRD